MSISHVVRDLLQELLESNRSPEDVCSEHPELLPEVRKQLKRARNVEAQLGELFPSSVDGLAIDFKSSWGSYGELPQIPGYTIEEVIGQGGMGVVFRARHHGLNRFVAIKMLLGSSQKTENKAR